MLECAQILNFDVAIKGSNNYDDISNSDVVIITAGLARKPGMSREELLEKNANIIGDIALKVKKHAPQAVIINVTNPVDILTYHAFKKSGFNKNKIMGQAGVLDSSRFATFISEELDVSVKDLRPLVLGGHGDTMVPAYEYTTLNGLPLTYFIEEKRLSEIGERTAKGGGEIVALLKTGSAYYAPAAATAIMAEAIVKDQKRLIAASCVLEGEYGHKGLCIGVPAILGKNGIEKIIELDLKGKTKDMFDKSAETYKKGVTELPK
jgi:malate dehydrogenase